MLRPVSWDHSEAIGSDVVFDSLYSDSCLRSSWHLDIAMLFLHGDITPMSIFVSAMFGLSGSRVWWWMIWCHLTFLIYHTFDVILGHILFWLRFIDLHGVTCTFSLTRCAPGRWHVSYLVMFPRWSLFGVIQPNPHLLAFGCHHVYYSGRRFIDVWV